MPINFQISRSNHLWISQFMLFWKFIELCASVYPYLFATEYPCYPPLYIPISQPLNVHIYPPHITPCYDSAAVNSSMFTFPVFVVASLWFQCFLILSPTITPNTAGVPYHQHTNRSDYDHTTVMSPHYHHVRDMIWQHVCMTYVSAFVWHLFSLHDLRFGYCAALRQRSSDLII